GVQCAGKVLSLMLVLITVASAWRIISYYVGGAEGGRMAAEALLHGQLATNFWVFEITVGLALPLLLLVITGLKSVAAMSAASLMTLVGLFARTFNTVVAGQVVPNITGTSNYPAALTYSPSIAEIMLVMAGVGVVGAAFLLGERFFGRAYALGDH
ncbi:MAG TPA: polysulfide reductase NrfD, partial [Desulfobacteraceae bacterium]|nr:polysulfide reductase NrfD [Desulfobacteraceae bacterium]